MASMFFLTACSLDVDFDLSLSRGYLLSQIGIENLSFSELYETHSHHILIDQQSSLLKTHYSSRKKNYIPSSRKHAYPPTFTFSHGTKTLFHAATPTSANMDRSLDEIIAERPVCLYSRTSQQTRLIIALHANQTMLFIAKIFESWWSCSSPPSKQLAA